MVWPTHDVYSRAFRNQREDCERIGILAANEPAHRPKLTRKCPERVAVSARMDQALTNRRHDFLVLADKRAVRAYINLGVEHRPRGLWKFLADSDHNVGVCGARGAAQCIGFRTGNFDRILEQLD